MADLISRAAACECIGKMIHEYREKGKDNLADGMILARRYGIKCLPAVDAIPVEWLRGLMIEYANINMPEHAAYAYCLNNVIEGWWKEQGAR